MPKRGLAALLITTVALILLLSFKTPDDTLPTRPTGVAAVDQGTGAIVRPQATHRPARDHAPRATAAPRATQAPAGTSPTPTPTPAPATGGNATNGASKTVDGPVVSTRFGDVQVEVVVAGGKVTDVVALAAPDRPALGPDLRLRRADPAPGGAPGAERATSTSCPARPTPATPTPSRSSRRSTRPGWGERGRSARDAARGGRDGHDASASRSGRRWSSDDVLDGVVAQLHDIDARFSPYSADSEVSRLAMASWPRPTRSPDLRHVLAACDHLAVVTGGAFDARAPSAGRAASTRRASSRAGRSRRPPGCIDSAGGRNYWINAGGDIVARGEAAPGEPWRVGIRHPDRADRVAAVLAVSDRAVATSGAYERGDHIADPRSGAAPVGPAQRHGRRAGPRLHRCLRHGDLRHGPRRPRLARDRSRTSPTTRPTPSPTTTARSGPRGWSATWCARHQLRSSTRSSPWSVLDPIVDQARDLSSQARNQPGCGSAVGPPGR